MKKELIQFKTIAEIDKFLDKCDSCCYEYFDEAYEGIAYVYGPVSEEKEFVKEFNKAVKRIFKVVTK